MPIITFFQTKGGTGKTTSAFLLAELLARGTGVTVIDADPNHPFKEWQKDGGKEHGFTIVTENDPERLPQALHDASTKSPLVIVDTEGTANMAAAQAVVVSDIVIITTTGTPLDQKAAAKAIKFVRAQAKASGRDPAIRVLMTRQKAVGRSRTLKDAEEKMRKHGIAVFNTMLIERDAFSAIFGYATTLLKLDPKRVNQPQRGYYNARVYANEVTRLIGQIIKDRQAGQGAKPEKDEEAA